MQNQMSGGENAAPENAEQENQDRKMKDQRSERVFRKVNKRDVGPSWNKKLSCRRETARRFVSLNILLSHSRSLKIIQNDTVE